jgi:replicative DNA helicase
MHGASVLFVSMEMTLKQIGNRFYGQYSGINPDCIRKGQLSHWTYRRFRDAVRTLDGSNRFNLYAGNMGKTVDDVDILIQELAPDIVFIDGMYLMKPSGLKGNVGRYERIAYVLDELKTVTLVRDRPLITTTQFGKGAGKGGKGGDLENIGYTDTIATHSSIVMGIKMPAGDKSKYPKTREIDLLKGREGEQADFNINYTFAPVDFSERVGEKPFRQQSETPEANMDWMG